MLDLEYRKIPLKKQAELLDVNRTSVYYRPREKEDKDIELMHRIDEITPGGRITDTVASQKNSRTEIYQ